MGRSTVQELITTGQNMNSYNNSGIDSNAKWIDAFNSALYDLVEDIGLTDQFTINFVSGTREYDLPDDFFELLELNDNNFQMPVQKRRNYNVTGAYYSNWMQGYYILNKGTGYKIDLYNYASNNTFTGIYTRYPVLLGGTNVLTQQPEVPTIGEDALIMYAIAKSLRNNNQPGQAQDIERQYEMERRKIRDAAQRAFIGGG